MSRSANVQRGKNAYLYMYENDQCWETEDKEKLLLSLLSANKDTISALHFGVTIPNPIFCTYISLLISYIHIDLFTSFI